MAAVAGGQMRNSARSGQGRRAALQADAFDAFPYGLLVLDRGGLVVCSNREATRLIDRLGLDTAGLTCCTLLGCRHAGHGARGRLHHRPRARARHPARGDPRRAGLGLRHGDLGHSCSDRRHERAVGGGAASPPHRRPSRSRWLVPRVDRSGPRLHIRTLGGTGVESPERAARRSWLDQRAGQLLKFLLAERRRAVAVDEIGESIWPGSDYAVGASVRYYVHTLRRRLEPKRGSREPSAFIASGGGTYRLQLDHVDVDADDFEARVRAGLAAPDAGVKAAVEDLERGLAIYRGDFLAELPYANGRCQNAIVCTIWRAWDCGACPRSACSWGRSTALRCARAPGDAAAVRRGCPPAADGAGHQARPS